MSGSSDQERLRQLEAKLAAKRAAATAQEKNHQDEHYSQANMAWRMVIELVAGLGIGFGIGIGLDALIGTRPLMLVLFTLLGFAAGVQTMMRTAKEFQDAQRAAKESPEGQD